MEEVHAVYSRKSQAFVSTILVLFARYLDGFRPDSVESHNLSMKTAMRWSCCQISLVQNPERLPFIVVWQIKRP
jgi:hypothetical protein